MFDTKKLKSARVIGRYNPEGSEGKVRISDREVSLYDFVLYAVNDDITNRGEICKHLKGLITSVIEEDIANNGPICRYLEMALDKKGEHHDSC